MSFHLDQQTLLELQIFFDEKTDNTVYGLFNKTATEGGRALVKSFMESPTSDYDKLAQRIAAIKFFHQNKILPACSNRSAKSIEYYLSLSFPILPGDYFSRVKTNIVYFLRPSSEIYNIYYAIREIIILFSSFSESLNTLSLKGCPKLLSDHISQAKEVLSNKKISTLLERSKKKKLRLWQLLRYDTLFRRELKEEVRLLLELIYLIDAYSTIAKVAESRTFSYPSYSRSDSEEATIALTSLFHPLLTEPVGNDVSIDGQTSLCLISGPNMAGKSTFLKSLGIAVYLAHIGFPVPANSMKTSIFKGLATTINLGDSLNRGYSHFYSEVKRVKSVVDHIREFGEMVVIFDELFRGTNVKDAFEGSLLLARGFAELPRSKVFISTHVVEVIEALSKERKDIMLSYFEAQIQANTFEYDYQLRSGYSAQRLGTIIIENEKILEVLAEIKAEAGLSLSKSS